jgi:outer membrane biosynthesis protein TonB
MEQQLFADGIGRISVIGGVVRLDLMTYSATETDAKGQPRPIVTQRIIMGTDGFLRSSEKILEAVQVLNQKQPAPAQPISQPAPQPQPAAPPPPRPESPRAEKIETAPRPMPSPWSEPLVPKLPFP